MRRKPPFLIPFLCFLGTIAMLFPLVFCLADETDTVAEVTPLPAPSDLTATVISHNQINLSWPAVAGAVSYKVYRGGVWLVSLTTTSYSDTGLSPKTTYSYTVSAVNIHEGESFPSAPASATTQSTPTSGGGMPPAWLMPPKIPESGFQILINQGVAYTESRIVALSLFGGPNTKRMAISNFSDFRDAGQETYQTSKSWNLCQGKTECPEGEYIIYTKFYTDWGTASEAVSDSIIYRERPIIEKIKQKLVEVAEKNTDLKNQIARLFLSSEEIISEETPPEEIPLPIEEPPVEEMAPPLEEVLPPEKIIPPSEELPKPGPIEVIKEFGKWLWQKITNFWQKIWPF